MMKKCKSRFRTYPVIRVMLGTMTILSIGMISTLLIRQTPDISMLSPLGLLPLTGLAAATALRLDRARSVAGAGSDNLN